MADSAFIHTANLINERCHDQDLPVKINVSTILDRIGGYKQDEKIRQQLSKPFQIVSMFPHFRLPFVTITTHFTVYHQALPCKISVKLEIHVYRSWKQSKNYLSEIFIQKYACILFHDMCHNFFVFVQPLVHIYFS